MHQANMFEINGLSEADEFKYTYGNELVTQPYSARYIKTTKWMRKQRDEEQLTRNTG